MGDFRKIAEEALRKARGKVIKEGITYEEGITERMAPELEEDLKKQNHSLGKHPIFPEGDECSFEERIMVERFADVVRRYKRTHDVDSIDNKNVIGEMMPLVYETMGLEAKHKKALQELAIKMIRDEYGMGEDVVEINAKLVSEVNMEGTKKNPTPTTVKDMQFESHDELVNANEEVYKRRFLNAMTQGAAKKCNHMFHMVDEELTKLDPKLPSKYSKMMSAADYMFYVIPKLEEGVNGGVVRVDFPSTKNPKAVINAEAMVFPVLIHELVKGVMELLSAHGLPKEQRIGEYVINKADFLAAEPWDMRLGPALWERFTRMIEPDDFHLKHHVYSELAALPVKEFNSKMKEIMAGTKQGKKLVQEIMDNVKSDLKEEEFNEVMNELSKNQPEKEQGFSFDELGLNDSEPEDDGFDWNDIEPMI